MTYLTIEELNSNAIYQPPATWINPLPTNLLNDIKTRNYCNCVCGRSKSLIQHTPKNHALEYLEKPSWGRIYTEAEKNSHDNYGFFFIWKQDYNPDSCGVEVVGRTIQSLNVVGEEHHLRQLLINEDIDIDCQDCSTCKDLAWVKKVLKMNNVKGRSKATTMKKAVKLLMSF